MPCVRCHGTGKVWYRWQRRTFITCRKQLKRIFGIDLTNIPGIRIGIAQTLLGKIGPNFTKFRSASAFASWMGLCPDNEISGGKVLWVGTRKVNCRAATALRMAAQSLHHSKSALGDFYRRMRAKTWCPQGHHRRGPQTGSYHFSPNYHSSRIRRQPLCCEQLRHQKRQEIKLRAKAKAMGFELIPLQPAA